MRKRNQLVEGCIETLEQGLTLIEKIDERLYTETCGLPIKSGVGGHIRHCLDFFQSFLAGVATGRIDYEQRERDTLVERDRAFAATKLRIVISELRALQWGGDARVLVHLEGETDASTGAPSWCSSTVARELQSLLSHTIHHYALVALTLRLQGFEPCEEFGVAPSTLKHWRREEEAACVL